ncbi:MAG TPA: protein kinase [Ktedonobacteraceae bacterium]
MPGLEGISLGRYLLKRRLGRGGMAEVYLATDQRMQRDVAVKIVGSSQTEFAERFSREAQAMGNLHHDHLLPAYDVGAQGPWHYLVMPYVAQGTLDDYLKKQATPPGLAYAGELLQQIASGLYYAHQRGLIHRDIKPSNILLRDDHYVYLADFGLARALEGGGDLTQTGTLLGTPEYMAPELAEGPAGTSADIYALAIVLYQMIAGRVPFRGDTAISTFWKHLRETPQPPSYYNPRVPKAVDRVLMRALDKDPAQRYDTPLALVQAYQQAINDLEEMPSLYDTEVMSESLTPTARPGTLTPSPSRPETARPPAQSETPRQPAQPETPRQAEQEKLYLQSERAVATPSASSPSRPPITPARNFEQTTDHFSSRSITRAPRARRRRGQSGRVLATIIMGIIFVVSVSSILAYLGVRTRQQNEANSTATARAGATSSVIAVQTEQIHATHVAQTAVVATATAQAIAAIHHVEATAGAITSQPPALNDPLSAQDANNWPNDGSNCFFQNNAYYAAANTANVLQPCIASVPQYSDAAIQIDVTLYSAADAGLIFRANAAQSQFYDFEVNNQGEFYLRYFTDNKPTFMIQKTASSAIQPFGSKNTLLVIARGNNFQLFINGSFVGKIQDSTFSSGQIGVAAGTLSANSGNASFTNLRVYNPS